jgi:hypothetical protein
MWSEVGERSSFGPAVIKEAKEGVIQVRENLRVTKSIRKIMWITNGETLSSRWDIMSTSKSPHFEALPDFM